MRGQAFLVFTDLAGATSAMRACEGMMFYDKPLHVDYAKTKSYATLQREDPNFIPPTAANASSLVTQNGKRPRDGDTGDSDRHSKREKADDSDEEMEIDDDDEKNEKNDLSAAPSSVPAQVQQPSLRLLCTNLPQVVTNDVLSVLFQQYSGFQKAHVTWSPALNPAGIRVKMAQVLFETPELATIAKDALDGFTLEKGWQMSVVYIWLNMSFWMPFLFLWAKKYLVKLVKLWLCIWIRFVRTHSQRHEGFY